MTEPVDPVGAAELYALYAELHLTCERAAVALRLNGLWDAQHDEMLERFRNEEARAEAIWQKIKALQANG